MSVATDGLDDVYAALERYDWDNDAEFQSGLSAILGSNSTPEQATELALRARCFYYSRKLNTNIDFESYKSYRAARNRPPPTPPTTNGTIAPSILDTLPTTDDTPVPSVNTAAAPAPASEQPAPYPTSFAHIVELISTGKPVPGIKEIPPTVLEGQGTQATKERRRKPWEKDDVTTGAEESGASVIA
ncbi:hypothetical protein T440DRAFT_434864 [Plenodomus tracheiphilus IPT5]|uniref:Uncharacterized protein n=1 Tax=Plenodomus tracheiphilus IPT5 TaxID=1408161 RepID=A0A6A7APY5_9PLEO|nr:hypothetical protein T440DRAFT_434864 [Plenodomus tracheiphilus IPT5]